MTVTDLTPLDAALAYATYGWRVVPIKPGDKRPPMTEWQDKATTDEALIRQWWERWPDHGVGIATGTVSDLFVLDVDVSDGKQGDETLADLEATYGVLPPTVEVLTGSGGRHLYFRMPDDVIVHNDAGKRLGPGLDIRGEGGQVLAPPTIHPNGRRYEWETAGDPELVDVAVPPDWLVTLLTAVPDEPVRRPSVPLNGDVRPGDRWAAAHDWHELLTKDGATYLSTRTDHRGGTSYEMWARPGVDHASGTVGYGGSDVLKVFSSEWRANGVLLEQDSTYTKFGYWAATRYGGDHAAAARNLAEDFNDLSWAETAETLASTPVDELESFLPPDLDEFLDVDEEPYAWVVEGLAERGDRIILTGIEGKGKSTLLRQMAVQLASGVHPFTHEEIEPQEVLYVDCENSARQLRRKLRELRSTAGDGYCAGRLRIHVVEDALELAKPAIYESVALRVHAQQPQVIVIGPLYKMIDGDPIKEEPAKALATALDRLRHICSSVLLIEAHSPYPESGKSKRLTRPYGASLWSRWPEFGIYLSPEGELDHWRGPREERAWPARLERGSPWPWMPGAEDPDLPEEAYSGPTKCAAAVVEVLARDPGQEVSGNRLIDLMKAAGFAFHEKTVRAGAELAAQQGTIKARSGPRNSRIYWYDEQGVLDDRETF